MGQHPLLPARRVGILDVAARAGVSRQTVTRAMNDMPGIDPGTKNRVLQAARELHYRPSRFARGLVTRGNPTLGLVVVDLRNSFWAEFASHVLEAASRRGWTVLIVESAHGGAGAIEDLVAQVDAVIGQLGVDEVRIEEIFGPMPVVRFDAEADADSRATVSLEFGAALDAAVEHLVGIGRRTIVMLDWSVTAEPSRRGQHCADALQSRRIEPRAILTPAHIEPDIDGGRAAAAEALARWPAADALVCFNDVTALGAMKELSSRGISVPDDVAVVGIDGLTLGVVVTPELTTLQFDFAAMAELTVDLVTEIAGGRRQTHGVEVHRDVSPALLIRQSA
jgi:DNA-binding LacI/PurR family transcriptional regulator